MHTSPEARIDKLRASPPIPIESVDYTINDPRQLRASLGETFQYFERVETEVGLSDASLRVLLPRIDSEKSHTTSSAFIDVWVPQEKAHGELFRGLLEKIDMPTLKVAHSGVKAHDKLAHLGGRASGYIHDVIESIYLTRGAMHERLTAGGYRLMADKLSQLGEKALVSTMIQPILRQEGGHLGYYRAAAEKLKLSLSDRQLAIARYLSVRSYAPVGVSNDEQRRGFGIVSATLAGEQLDAFAAPVQILAQELLLPNGAASEMLPAFVYKSLRECVELARV